MLYSKLCLLGENLGLEVSGRRQRHQDRDIHIDMDSASILANRQVLC